MKVKVIYLAVAVVLMFALVVAIAPAADAQTEYPCVYIGLAFLSDDASNPVPAGTGIRGVPDLGTPAEITTGFFGGLADNEFYLDGVMAVPGTTVHFQIWDAGLSAWVDAIETAVHIMYGRVDINLHTGVPTIHIDSSPFLFVYPGPDCALPEAMTNIDWGEVDDCGATTIWGTVDHDYNPATMRQWSSYDVAIGAGFLGPWGLEAGRPYIMTHDDCFCTDWEMCQ